MFINLQDILLKVKGTGRWLCGKSTLEQSHLNVQITLIGPVDILTIKPFSGEHPWRSRQAASASYQATMFG